MTPGLQTVLKMNTQALPRTFLRVHLNEHFQPSSTEINFYLWVKWHERVSACVYLCHRPPTSKKEITATFRILRELLMKRWIH